MSNPDDTQPESQLKAAPDEQRRGTGPEDLLHTTEQERQERERAMEPSDGDAPAPGR